MDLGIKGRKALVCASSKGLGRACAMSLAREGVELTILARGQAALDETADEIRKAYGVRVTAVACDITTPAGRTAALAACPDPDILITNGGGPKTGDFRDWSREDWIAALDMVMLTPIEMIRSTVDHMIRRRFGRIVNITSGTVKHPLDVLGLSNGGRAGLTGFVAGLARKTVAHNVTINNALPGFHETERNITTVDAMAKIRGMSPADMKSERIRSIPAQRIGDPAEFGDMVAYLCSAQAGFITGQNLLADGGAYPGTF